MPRQKPKGDDTRAGSFRDCIQNFATARSIINILKIVSLGNLDFDMPTLKDITIEVLKDISPTASLEEIMYRINLAAQVMEGIKDADQSKVISTEDLLKQMDAWGK